MRPFPRAEIRVFTPGPTALHPLVADEIRAALSDGFLSESHRSPRFRAEVQGMEEALRALLGIPADHRILIVASATEAMERIVAGAVRERSAHLVQGAFARRFRDVSANLGRQVVTLEVPDGEGLPGPPGPGRRPGSAEEVGGRPGSRGSATVGDLHVLDSGAELLALTQNETSTGVRIPASTLGSWARRAREVGALTAVDLVSGWPAEDVDPTEIDAGFFSVQKGFGLPAGLGVIVASPALVDRAIRLQRDGHPVGGYLGIPQLAVAADRGETRVTPNMLAIRLLRTVAEAYVRRGREALMAETEEKARWFWEAVAGLDGISPFVADPDVRSRTVLVAEVEAGSEALRRRLLLRGFRVDGGYGGWKDRHIRVANFPVQPPELMEALLEALRQEGGSVR